VLVYLQTPRPGLRGGRSSYSATGCSPEVEKIVPLQDNLNTHTPASPYKASEPEKAGRLVEKTGEAVNLDTERRNADPRPVG